MNSMQPSDYFAIAQQIFSKNGFSAGAFEIKCPTPLSIKTENLNDGIKIKFEGTKPKVTVRKFIRLSLSLSGIHLSKTGGVLEIENFPDIAFSYSQL